MLRTIIIIIIILAILIWLSFIFDFKTRLKLRQLSKKRRQQPSFEEFVRLLPYYPKDKIEIIYRKLQVLVPCSKFPILPQDDLHKDLNIDVGNLEELAKSLNMNKIPHQAFDFIKMALDKTRTLKEPKI
jgi:hypothetical protein